MMCGLIHSAGRHDAKEQFDDAFDVHFLISFVDNLLNLMYFLKSYLIRIANDNFWGFYYEFGKKVIPLRGQILQIK